MVLSRNLVVGIIFAGFLVVLMLGNYWIMRKMKDESPAVRVSAMTVGEAIPAEPEARRPAAIDPENDLLAPVVQPELKTLSPLENESKTDARPTYEGQVNSVILVQ